MSTEQVLEQASSTIKKTIKAKLVDEDMKQIDLAKKLNVPKSSISHAINGSAGKRFELIRKQIYKELGLDSEEV